MAAKSGKVQKVEVVKPIPQSAANKADRAREEEWRIEDDARTLQRAAEIRKDKPRLAKVRAWAKKRASEIAEIGSIKD